MSSIAPPSSDAREGLDGLDGSAPRCCAGVARAGASTAARLTRRIAAPTLARGPASTPPLKLGAGVGTAGGVHPFPFTGTVPWSHRASCRPRPTAPPSQMTPARGSPSLTVGPDRPAICRPRSGVGHTAPTTSEAARRPRPPARARPPRPASASPPKASTRPARLRDPGAPGAPMRCPCRRQPLDGAASLARPAEGLDGFAPRRTPCLDRPPPPRRPRLLRRHISLRAPGRREGGRPGGDRRPPFHGSPHTPAQFSSIRVDKIG